jgi:hypothetical protein
MRMLELTVQALSAIVQAERPAGTAGLADGACRVTIALATTSLSPGGRRWGGGRRKRSVSTPAPRRHPTAGVAPDGPAVFLDLPRRVSTGPCDTEGA